MAMTSGDLEELARTALAQGSEEEALRLIAPAARGADDPRLWQFTGLLQRALDEHADALQSLAAAARLAPSDPSIALGHARVAFEAGVDSVALFERAGALTRSGAVLIGLAAAKFAAGRGEEAATDLEARLREAPLWIEGHAQLAQLRSMLGERSRSTESLEEALSASGGDPDLWSALFNIFIGVGDFEQLDRAVTGARYAGCTESLIAPFQAIAAAECGQMERADVLFAGVPADDRASIGLWFVRHLLRSGRIPEALTMIDRELQGPRAASFWPYAAIAWRLAGDPRSDWLNADGQLVATVDLTDRLPPLTRLASVLRSLHVAKGEYLDQSVRGGTQTDGPLLSRIEPEIRLLRSAIADAVGDYVRGLPPADYAHPLLFAPRDRRIRFAGSWSVRLSGAGFHASHVHPQGWISSALYVALPEAVDGGDPHAGWLKLGEPPPELGLDLGPTQRIQPKPGRLVLFPSWMWHGTIPFAAGERLSVAFDVQRPVMNPPLVDYRSSSSKVWFSPEIPVMRH